MIKSNLNINGIPALLWGEPSDRLFIAVGIITVMLNLILLAHGKSQLRYCMVQMTMSLKLMLFRILQIVSNADCRYGSMGSIIFIRKNNYTILVSG